MVDTQAKPLTPKQRLDLVRKLTRCPKKAAFARWIGAKTPQAVQQWENREVTREGGLMIRKATGASLDFLLTGLGDPFPAGPTIYAGTDSPALAERVDTVASVTEQMAAVLGQVIRALSAKLPAVGQDLVQMLQAEVEASPGSNTQVLAEAIAAAKSGLAEAAPVAGSRRR